MEQKWREENGLIYFSVTSNGMTGAEWYALLNKKYVIEDYVKRILLSDDFKPTNEVTTEIAVLKAGLIKNNQQRRTKHICAMAEDFGLQQIPNAEIACLICEKFTDEDIKAMGIEWFAVMHEPIKIAGIGAGPGKYLFGFPQKRGNGLSVSYHSDRQTNPWHRNDAFAFAASHTPSK